MHREANQQFSQGGVDIKREYQTYSNDFNAFQPANDLLFESKEDLAV